MLGCRLRSHGCLLSLIRFYIVNLRDIFYILNIKAPLSPPPDFLRGRSPSPPKSPSLYVVLAKTNLGCFNRSKHFVDWVWPLRPPLNTPMVSHMFNISGHNVNFVCGLVDMSLDV